MSDMKTGNHNVDSLDDDDIPTDTVDNLDVSHIASIVKRFPLPSYVWKRKGDNFVLAYINDAATEVSDGRITHFHSDLLSDYFGPEHQMTRDITDCWNQKKDIQRDTDFQFTPDSANVHLTISYSYIPPDSVLMCTSDITEKAHLSGRLRETEQLYRSLIDGMSEAVVAVDIKGAILFINSGAERLFGYTSDELIGNDVEMLLPIDVRMIHSNHRKRFLDNPATRLMGQGRELFARHKDGHIIPVEIGLNISEFSNETIVIALISDITYRKNLETALSESTERWRFALEGSNQGVWDWNVETGEVYFSQQWKAMIGFGDDDAIHTREEWIQRVHPDDMGDWLEDVERHFRGESPIIINEHRIRHSDGSYLWIVERGKMMSQTQDGEPLRIVGTHIDITERKRAQEMLEKAARTDMLTGLSSRMDFNEHFDTELSRYSRTYHPFSLVLSDIDHFKKVNDTYGHDCGDYVLTRIADIMRNSTRKQDVVGRWGGEEIILLLPETDSRQAGLLAEKIREIIASTRFVHKGNDFSVTMSFGVSMFTKEMTKESLIKTADNKLYQAKAAGRNKVIV